MEIQIRATTGGEALQIAQAGQGLSGFPARMLTPPDSHA